MQVAIAKVDAKLDFIELLDGDEPIPDPTNDIFNLANWIPKKEVNIAMEEAGNGGETLKRIKEQEKSNFVRVKYEFY